MTTHVVLVIEKHLLHFIMSFIFNVKFFPKR